MCNAWLLLTRQGPDGARAHTGYAYGPLRAAERLVPKHDRSTPPPGPRSSAAESAQCRCRPHELGPAAIRPRRERPRGEAANRSTHRLITTHTDTHTHTQTHTGKGGASDGVMAVSCGVKEHLRRLFTSNLGFDHSLRQTQPLGRGFLQRTKVGSGTRSHRDHGYYRFQSHTHALTHRRRGRKRRPSDWGDN